MKFIIDRRVWLRGEGSANSFLLRPADGKMCCMGQVCLQLGVVPADLERRKIMSGEQEMKLTSDRCLVNAAYSANDNEFGTDAAREEKLTDIFGTIGHEIEFINQ